MHQRRRAGARAGAGLLISIAVAAWLLGVTYGVAGAAEPVAPASSARLQPPVPDVPAAAPAPGPRMDWKAYPPAVPPAYIPIGREAVSVPILMYHYIRVNPVPGDPIGADLSVTPADFAAQLDWLDAQGYHPIDFNDLRAYFDGRATLPSRPVILTFDDGYLDFYTAAYPLLLKHRFKGVAYVVSGFMGSPGRNVTPEQVVDMDRNGIEVASHTFSHADLSQADPGRLAWELGNSRAQLERLLHHPVLDFCYPYGRLNDAAVQAVEQAGYLTATTTEPGTVHSAADRYRWTRVRVHGGEGLDGFAASLGPEEPAVIPPLPQPPVENLGQVLPDLPGAPPAPGLRLMLGQGLPAKLLPNPPA